MISRTAIHVDNRDATQMYDYLEARIEVLKRRVAELEAENQTLRRNSLHEAHRSSKAEHVSHAQEVTPVFPQRIAG